MFWSAAAHDLTGQRARSERPHALPGSTTPYWTRGQKGRIPQARGSCFDLFPSDNQGRTLDGRATNRSVAICYTDCALTEAMFSMTDFGPVHVLTQHRTASAKVAGSLR